MKNTIEVELKFILTPEQEELLLAHATFVKKIEFTDTYYDTTGYGLTTKDIWLRARNGKFVLKYPLATTSDVLKLQYNAPKQEIEDEETIRKTLSIPLGRSLREDLIKSHIKPLYTFRNIRKKYSKNGFNIDLDTAIFDDFTYETCEIECEVGNAAEIDAALEKIVAFATAHGLSVKPVEGRLIEYLRRKHPTHYHALQHKTSKK